MNLFLASLALLTSTGIPQEELRSRHYDLKTDCTPEQGQQLLKFMELVHRTYSALLKPENPAAVDRKRLTLILFRDRKGYVKAGGPPTSGAFYTGKKLVGWYDRTWMRPLFAHEGMHQFTDATSANFKAFPMWFSEGIADCIGNCEVREGKLYLCVSGGMLQRLRLGVIQEAIRRDLAYPLDRLLRLDRRQFMGNATLCYAQSWSFCHFLICFPKFEDRSRQIPNGRYRKNLAGYYEMMRRGGTTHDRAWKAAFGRIKLAELEASWKKYVLAMDAGKYIGIRGEEIKEQHALDLKLPKGTTGIFLVQVPAGGVAAEAGIRAGDILIRFDRKRFPRNEALERLRSLVQGTPTGRPVQVVVLRDGKEVTCRCVWKK